MLPERKREAAEAGGSRGGFEVRVIGGVAPPSVESERAAPGVELGLVIGQRSSRPRPEPPVADEGPVHRLEVEEDGDQVKARSMSEVGPAVPRASSRAKKKRQRLQQVTIWMAAGVCGIAVAAVGGLMLSRKSALPETVEAQGAVQLPASPQQSEETYFLTHADELTKEAESLLRKYAEFTSAKEALPLLRDPQRVAEAVAVKWKAWGTEPKFATGNFTAVVNMSRARPSVDVTGMRGDFTKFSFNFVRQEGRLVLDWEATEGIGDLQIAELKAGTTAKDATVRALVSPAEFYTPDFPEDKYRCYKLVGQQGDEFAWGYVALDSPAAEALKRELNEDSFILKGDKEIRATLRLNGPGRSGSAQYLITEMLHKGWVSP